MQHPGFALNKLLFSCFALWLSYRWASTPGWEPAWLFVAVFAVMVLGSAREVIQAHRAWTQRRKLARMVPPPEMDPHGTDKLWQKPPEPQRDRGWHR